MVRLTRHADDRLSERQNITRKQNQASAFNDAMRLGKSPAQFTGAFNKYLQTKLWGHSKIKVYNAYIWIYINNKAGPKLITTYKVPEEYAHFLLKDYKGHRKQEIDKLNTEVTKLRDELKEFKQATKDIVYGDILTGRFESYEKEINSEIERLEKEMGLL